jgi:eukaryotic-like serine/threonine-protein kinase
MAGPAKEGGRRQQTRALSVPQGIAPGQTLAGWVLLREIGRGASSTVYLATKAATGQTAAIKVLPLAAGQGQVAAGERFVASARAAMALQHPGIVQVQDAGVAPGLVWQSMEAVPGSDLGRYTRPPRLLPETLVVKLGWRLAQALAYAHQQGVVHRDVKAANVLVDWPSDTVKLTDFGIARVTGASSTGTGIVLGTPGYMAPEQLAGSLPSVASDLYALGVLLFELFCGRLPHEGRSMGELLRQVALETPPNLLSLRPDLPLPLSNLLARLLAKVPQERPVDASYLARELQQIASDMTAAGAKSR